MTPYAGQGAAGLSPAQLQAIQLAMSNAGHSSAVAAPAVEGATNAMNFQAPQVSTADIGAGINGLLNPYVNAQVTDATNAFERERQIAEARNGSAAAASHAFGGDRHGVVDALNNRDFLDKKSSAITGLLSGAYDKALGTSTNVAQGNQNAAIAGAGVNLNGANSLANIGSVLQNLGISDINALLGAGGVAQQTDQAGRTFDYNEFVRQQQQQSQNRQLATQAIASAPHGQTGQATETQQIYSNPLAGIAGLGLGIAGVMSGNPMAASGIVSGLGGLLGGGGSNPTGFSTNPWSSQGIFGGARA